MKKENKDYCLCSCCGHIREQGSTPFLRCISCEKKYGKLYPTRKK